MADDAGDVVDGCLVVGGDDEVGSAHGDVVELLAMVWTVLVRAPTFEVRTLVIAPPDMLAKAPVMVFARSPSVMSRPVPALIAAVVPALVAPPAMAAMTMPVAPPPVMTTAMAPAANAKVMAMESRLASQKLWS